MNQSSKIIISLLVANLVATVWFGISSNNTQSNQKSFEHKAKHDLPPVISNDVKSSIFQIFKNSFNSHNYENLYNMFGPLAKAQISREKMDVEFTKLTNLFHSIKDGKYDYAELMKRQGDTSVFILHYALQLSEKSTVGTIGDLKVTVVIEGNNYQIYGIRLFSET